MPAQSQILDREKSHRSGVGEGCGDGGPGDVQVEAENQDRVKDHVQDPTEHHAGAGLFGVSLAAQQMSQGQAHHGGHAAQDDHPEQVGLRVGVGVRTGPQKGEQGPPGQKGPQGETGGHRRSEPEAEGRHVFDIPVVSDPKHAGDQTAAPQSEQIAQGGEQVEPGGYQGHRRHHIGVSDLSHKKGVRQIVDHSHHLADDRGDGQRGHRLGDRDRLKQFFFAEIRHRAGQPSFL